MLPRSFAVATLILVLVTGGSAAGEARSSDSCPVFALTSDPLAPEHVLSAARREIPRRFGPITNQGGTFPLTPGRYVVTRVQHLQSMPERATFRSDSVRACGRNAERSWVVTIQIPISQTVPHSRGALIVAPTRDGWRVWRTYRW